MSDGMEAKEQAPFVVSVLVHRDGSAWVAQCLEHDVAVQGPNPDETKRRFMHMLTAQIKMDLADGKTPLVDLDPAPIRYFDQSATSRQGPELPVYVSAKPRSRVQVRARFLEAAEACA